MTADCPIVSVVLATHNRREVVANTLVQLERCGLDRQQFEIIAIDNVSSDGTCDAIADRVDRLIRLRQNRGSCAKAFGVDHARGRYVVFLDDDSYPLPGSLPRMIERFEEDPKLGAAGFTVTLPSGEREGAGLPGVFVGCGVGFRKQALDQVGGLDRTFFMQAEEYDLSFRLAVAGWNVKVFDDLHVQHLKTKHARRSERTTFHDVRNNLRVIGRYVPTPYHAPYREDCVLRYSWLAQRQGHELAFERGVRSGRRRAWLERARFRGRRLTPAVFERFFCTDQIERRMMELARSGVRRVMLADLGKNVLPFVRGAECAGIQIVSISDDRFAAPGRTYRGIPILPVDESLTRAGDAIVIANTGPVHAARTRQRLAALTTQPVFDWFGDSTPDRPRIASPPPTLASDDQVVVQGVF